MAHQSFEAWRDSDDGPRHHDLSEGDLHNAFDAGMELGAEREAALTDLDRLQLRILQVVAVYEADYLMTAQQLLERIEQIFNEEGNRVEPDSH